MDKQYLELISDAGPVIVQATETSVEAAASIAEDLRDKFQTFGRIFIISLQKESAYPEILEELVKAAKGFVIPEPTEEGALKQRRLKNAIVLTAQDVLGCGSCVNPSEVATLDEALTVAKAAAGEKGVVCFFGVEPSLPQ